MSEEPGARKSTIRSDVFVEVVLLAVLAVYFIFAQNQLVGDDLVFTVIGAGLMAAVSFWTLTTVKDGLELVAVKARRS